MNTTIEALNVWGARFIGVALPMLLQSAILIALLFTLDLVLRKRVRATIRYAVWMLALVKLALPPSLASPTSAAYWLSTETTARYAAPVPAMGPAPVVVSGETSVNSTYQSASWVPRITPLSTESPRFTWQTLFLGIWAAVASGMGIWVVWRLREVGGIIRRSADATQAVQGLSESCRRQLGIKREIPVRCADIGSPAICGLMQPVILIPPDLEGNLGKVEMRSVFLHELAHYKRGDLWVNQAQIFMQIMYWYNPLLWLANARIRRAREQAVDEMVLVELAGEAQTYSATLVRVARLGLGRSLGTIGLVGILEPGRGLTQRIVHIMSHPLPRTARIGARGLAAVLLLGLVALPMACRSKAETAPETTVTESAQPNVDAGKEHLLKPDDSRSVETASLSSHMSNGNAVFHFKGRVDGSDRILITHDGAFWTHLEWRWPPGPVFVNDTPWNPSERSYLTTSGRMKFLPDSFSLASVDLEVIEGRDVVTLERTNNGLIVCLDDTPFEAGEYEFNINFHPAEMKPAAARRSAVARLKIRARVDGSDCIKITATKAVLDHKSFDLPSNVSLNGVSWDVGQTLVLRNEGATTFLPEGVDFSTARIVSRKGRDLVTAWGEKDALWVHFADAPMDRDNYEIEIVFGPGEGQP